MIDAALLSRVTFRAVTLWACQRTDTHDNGWNAPTELGRPRHPAIGNLTSQPQSLADFNGTPWRRGDWVDTATAVHHFTFRLDTTSEEWGLVGYHAGPDTIAWHLGQHHATTVSVTTISRYLTLPAVRGANQDGPGASGPAAAVRSARPNGHGAS